MIISMSVPPLFVAIVDDEESVRKALRRLLRSAGMDVETFPSGREFLDSLSAHQPDCLVLDYHMPGLTGLAVQHEIAALGINLPTIVITGHDQPGMESTMLKAGASAYLSKPVNDRVLLAAITTAVSGANLKRPAKDQE
jgi:FixJ family two-component response regulator